jgi:uncharacterized Tic20 family protein
MPTHDEHPDDHDDRRPRLARPVDRDADYDRDYDDGYDRGPKSEEKTMGLLAHLLGLFTWVIGPAILLFTSGDKSPFVARHAREALNCQVMQIVYVLIALLFGGLIGVAVGTASGTASVGFIVGALVYGLLAIACIVFEIVCVIKAAMAANRGHDYRYPLTVRLF